MFSFSRQENQKGKDNVDLGINVTLRLVPVTNVAVQKQRVLHILSVYLALCIQHVKCRRRIILSSVACLFLNIFPHFLKTGTTFGKGGGY